MARLSIEESRVGWMKIIGNEKTTAQLVRDRYEQYGDKRVSVRKKDFGYWNEYSWKDCYENIKFFSLCLASMGMQKDDKIAGVGDNDPHIFWAHIAAHSLGGVAMSFYADSIAAELKDLSFRGDASFIVCEDQEQVDKILEIKDDLPLLKAIFFWESKGLQLYKEPMLFSWDKAIEIGREYEKKHPGFYEKEVDKGHPDDMAYIFFSSGTTGLPKGVLSSHRNVLCSGEVYFTTDPVEANDEYVSFVDLAWSFDIGAGMVAWLYKGQIMSFCEKAETVRNDIREIGPQYLLQPARLWESIASMIQVRITDSFLIDRLMYNLFLPVGYKKVDSDAENGGKGSLFWNALWHIGNWLVFTQLRDKIGMSKVRFAQTAGAMTSPDTIRFFRAIGINLKQCYGPAETGMCLTHRDGDVNYDSIGMPYYTKEVRLTEQGELTFRGLGVFNGYYKDPQATAKKIDADGWIFTGDAATITNEGHVIFLDRMEDMRHLASSAAYSPQYVETRLRFSAYIKDAMVVGDNKDFISVIVIIDFDNVGAWAEINKIAYTTFTDLSQKKEVGELILKDVLRVNKNLPDWQKIKRFVNLHKEFDADEAELTRSKKLKRAFMEDRYKGLIDAIYSGKPDHAIVSTVVYQDGRKGTTTSVLQIRNVG